ncbi:PhoPQ-activated protein PqaA family protein [Prosthecobacter sp. SYSU 5D2]|uniref:PhoPQ-activated protein PqaA family protein n=1 Tax=Prosthecobacter sp. SYSU 5D2 TaxID=3134134 RepID=UPI0031FF335C
MKLFTCLLLLTLSVAQAGITRSQFDMAAVRDVTTLETEILSDWKPLAKDPSIRQKLVVITLCEWWPGQKVRLPVTFNAPADAPPCTRLVIANAGLAPKAAAPTGTMLRLLKEHGVGIVLVGMGTIDAMAPAPILLSGMKEHLLATKDTRYTPAWIWGMSDMRAITAAVAEKDVFQPQQILVTGGSKRGVAAAAAGIHDDRVTAIMPVVTPILDSPGGPYVHGMLPEEITRMNRQFLADITAGKVPAVPATASGPLAARAKTQAGQRIDEAAARAAGWSEEEMKAMCTAAWDVCRITDHWPALQARGLEVFYNQGSNDNVSPGLLELGRRFPAFPLCIFPGGQHGGPKDTGMTKQVSSLPEVEANLHAFALHHFFKSRRRVATPEIITQWDKAARTLRLTATFPDGSRPQDNRLWMSADRHPDYSMQMEFDAWTSIPMTAKGTTAFEASQVVEPGIKTLDLITVHAHAEDGSTLTVTSPSLRVVLD